VKDPEETKSTIRELFQAQQLAVLPTREDDGQPNASLMAFASSPDLIQLLLVTSCSTRKYANLSADPGESLLIDSRSQRSADVHQAVAVTVPGEAEEVMGPMRDHLLAHYLAKHPRLEGFATSPSCALLRVWVKSYCSVRRFQEVVELHAR
jgi:nitroimidazol reductase NimA-like FMN-containing flavoprotein (pyridoxamine 5'-phosphate oxidase superfamily)